MALEGGEGLGGQGGGGEGAVVVAVTRGARIAIGQYRPPPVDHLAARRGLEGGGKGGGGGGGGGGGDDVQLQHMCVMRVGVSERGSDPLLAQGRGLGE